MNYSCRRERSVALRTEVVGTVDQLRHVDVARAARHRRHTVVAGRKSRASEYTGNHVTRRVVAAADAAAVRPATGTDHSVTADQLCTRSPSPPASVSSFQESVARTV